MESVNAIRRERKTIKTDWDKYIRLMHKWQINHNLQNENDIDKTIIKLQSFLHKAVKDSSLNTLNLLLLLMTQTLSQIWIRQSSYVIIIEENSNVLALIAIKFSKIY